MLTIWMMDIMLSDLKQRSKVIAATGLLKEKKNVTFES